MKISLAIQITILRIVLAPIIVGCVIYQQHMWSVVLFAVAVLTDFLDGFIARRYHQESRVGQLLDPIADKTLIISLMYAVFLSKSVITSGIDFVHAIGWFFIVKEMVLLGSAAILYFRYDHFYKPTFFSRFVSVSEMIIIFNILACRAFHGVFSVNVEKVFFIICGLHLFITILGAVILLLQYAVSVVLLVRKKK